MIPLLGWMKSGRRFTKNSAN
uniref:Uncharacterized protein n=1 Tax=Oryza punctata TaxID=4537 RepID=A0A0E0MFR5_ORYPU